MIGPGDQNNDDDDTVEDDSPAISDREEDNPWDNEDEINEPHYDYSNADE